MNYKLLKDTPAVKAGAIYKIDQFSWYVCDDQKYFKHKEIPRSRYNKEVVESNPEWFEPIYEIEVGKYYKYPNYHSACDLIIQITNKRENITHKTYVFEFDAISGDPILVQNEFWSGSTFENKLIPLSQSEIDSATKKFPYGYSVMGNKKKYEFEVSDSVFVRNALSITDTEDNELVYLTESAWREIGKRKGWAL